MKLLAESLEEYRMQNSEEINEGMFDGIVAGVKKHWLKAAYALASENRKNLLDVMIKWIRHLARLGWPKDREYKAKNGDHALRKLNSFYQSLIVKQLPSFGVQPDGAVQSNRGKDIGKDAEARLAKVAKITGISVEELKKLL